MPDFKIEQENIAESGMVLLKVFGGIGPYTFLSLDVAISGVFASQKYRIILDFSQVPYMSSAGAGVFISARERALAHNGNLVILNPSTNVRELFDVLGLEHILNVVDSMESALACF